GAGGDLPRQPHLRVAGGGTDQGAVVVAGDVGQEQVVAVHHVVGQRHDLAEHAVLAAGRVGDGDVVADTFRHFLDAVGPDQQRRDDDDLPFPAELFLELPAHQVVKE